MLSKVIHARKGHSNIFNFKVAVTVFVTFSMMSRKGILSVLFVLFSLVWSLLLTGCLQCWVQHTQSVCRIFNCLLAPQSIIRHQTLVRSINWEDVFWCGRWTSRFEILVCAIFMYVALPFSENHYLEMN